MNSSIDQQFVEFVVRSLVNNPDDVKVDRRVDEKGVLLELTVNPEDLGRVIGKRGATAQSLRTLLRALGTKNDARYNLKIIDNGTGGHSHNDEADNVPQTSGNELEPTQSDDSATVPVEAVSQEQPEVVVDTPTELSDEATSDRLSQTRKELSDLDDLDI